MRTSCAVGASPNCRLQLILSHSVCVELQGKLGSLELSFDDDAFFAVPDTATNGEGRTSLDNAHGPIGKGFISEDVRSSRSIRCHSFIGPLELGPHVAS